MTEWDIMPASGIQHCLVEMFGVPAQVADSIRHRLEASRRKDIDIGFLNRRIAYLEQHVPEDIRNPPPPPPDTTRFTGD